MKVVTQELISAEKIAEANQRLAMGITSHYTNKGKLIVVGLLRGSFMFIADLVRLIPGPLEVDFMTVSSYGNNMESSRNVRVLKDLDSEILGCQVLIVEDIVDTGYTLKAVVDLLQTRNPASIRTCALLNKPSRREADVQPDWVGFDIPDEFVVGYGIDYAQSNRNLPYIAVVRQ